jgi:outer membrane protein assembly factor BamB
MKSRTLLLAVCLLALLVAAGAPESAARPPAPSAQSNFDWPQWRGPNRDDVSKETGLLKKWPEGGPKLLWTFTDAGVGYASFAVVGDRLYTMGADSKSEFVYALDLKGPKKAWSTETGALYSNNRGDGPRGVPTVDGDLLLVISGQGNLVCVKSASGEKVWQKSLTKDLGGKIPTWGYSESPLVDGDQVVCTPGGSNGAVAAFNKKNGELLWRSTDLKDQAGYSSLVIAEIGGVRQYVQMTGESVVGIAARDGKLLWRYARRGPVAAIPTPIVQGDLAYATSGYNAGCNLIKATPSSTGFKVEEIYANKEMVNHHGGVVLVNGYLYGFSDSERGRWLCQDLKSGKAVWSEKKLGKGSLTCADGQLYCFSEKEGTVVLVEASSQGWKENGRFTIPQQSKLPRPSGQPNSNIWTHPVVANGKLYLRDQDLIFCYDVKGGAAE